MKVEKLIRNFVLASKAPRWRRAFLIALLSDALGFLVVLFPPLQWTLDAITAVALLLVLGFRWKLLVALAIEVIPAIQLFPAWTLVILAMAATEKPAAEKQQVN
jgi:hypothetical protein